MIDQHIKDLYPDTYNNVAYIKREIIGTELYLTFKNANVKIDSHFLDMSNNPINNVSKISNINNISFDSNGDSCSLNNLKSLVFSSQSTISNLKTLSFQSDSQINSLKTLSVNRINFSDTNSMLYDLGRMNFSSEGEKSILNLGLIKSHEDGLVYDLNGKNITFKKSNNEAEIIKFYNNGDISCNNLIINGINNSQTAYSSSEKKLTIHFDKGLVTKEITVDSDINIINFIHTADYSYGSQIIIHINPSANTILKGKEDLVVQINGASSNGNQAYINFDSDIESSNTEGTSILITATNFSSEKFFLTASLLHKK